MFIVSGFEFAQCQKADWMKLKQVRIKPVLQYLFDCSRNCLNISRTEGRCA